MAEKTKTPTALQNEVRANYLEIIKDFFKGEDVDVLEVAGNKIAIPVLDSENNEQFIRVTVEVPKGEKDKATGKFLGYDGYEVAHAYGVEKQEKEDAKQLAKKKREEKEMLKKKPKTKPTKMVDLTVKADEDEKELDTEMSEDMPSEEIDTFEKEQGILQTDEERAEMKANDVPWEEPKARQSCGGAMVASMIANYEKSETVKDIIDEL